jgi:hypothetical protein
LNKVVASRKAQTNRANARASSGPKTALGKSRSARNAWRYGLSIPALSDPNLSPQIEELAQQILGGSADSELLNIARTIALAQIDLWRVKRTRHLLILNQLSLTYYSQSNEQRRQTIRLIKEALKFEAKHGYPMDIPVPLPAKGDRKFALVIADLTRELAAINRYESRARSRRKFAVRKFDATRQRIHREQTSGSP